MDNLPIQLTSFIGRDQELLEVRTLLTKTRLVTLTGPGGCGKTRLALQAAGAPLSPFADGRWWVDLASTCETSLVPLQVLAAVAPLGTHVQDNSPSLELLGAQIGAKQMLLMLDNCEHLTSACAELADTLLHTCPNLRILATSRESLGVGGEYLWRVSPLTIPPHTPVGAAPLSIDDLARYEAVGLFVERAEALNRNFRLSAHNAEAVAQICRRLDGIPLAIELAAARTQVVSVAQIAARLDDSFRLLGAGTRTQLPRHRTLRAAIDWSYDLLTPIEQALLRRLSVFSGGFGLEAVEAICAGQPEPHGSFEPVVDPDQVLDLLAGLVDKSLVMVHEQGDAARYRLLETIRQYCLEQLKRSGETAPMRTRHLEWYLDLAVKSDAENLLADLSMWGERLESESDNLTAALDWSLMISTDEALNEMGIHMVYALCTFWSLRGHAREGRIWLDKILKLSYKPGTALQAKVAAGTGLLAWCQNDYAQASLSLHEGQAIARSLGAEGKSTLQVCLNILGFVAYYQDDYPRANALFEEWLMLLRELGEHRRIPFALSLLGRVAVRQGDYARAILLGEESLSLSRQQANEHSISATLNLLGTVACYQGSLETAEAFLAESLVGSRALSYPQDIADTLVVLATVALHERDLPRAKAALAESLAVSEAIGYRQGVALAQARLGEVAHGQGDPEGAWALLRDSLILFDQLAAGWHTLHCLETMAMMSVAQAQPRLSARQAVQLLAAGHALRVARGSARPPVDQPRYERAVAALRATLGDTAFTAAWAEGLKMELAQAIALALQPTHTPTTRLATIQSRDDEVPLRICALGCTRVFRTGTLLTAADWTYAKPKELLIYLLCQPPRTRAQIGLVFWPDASPAQLRTRLHDTLHRLRHALGDADWIVFADHHYTFNRTPNYWFDVELFESQIRVILRRRRTPPNPALLAQLEETLLLYQGDFAEEMELDHWVLPQREALRSSYLEGVMMLGEWRFALGDFEAAVAAYRQAIHHDPFLEAAHRELMRCLARQGATHQLIRQYGSLVELLHDELGVSPAPETINLYESLHRRQAV